MILSYSKWAFWPVLFVFAFLIPQHPIHAQIFRHNTAGIIAMTNVETTQNDSSNSNATDYEINPLLPVVGGVVTAVALVALVEALDEPDETPQGENMGMEGLGRIMGYTFGFSRKQHFAFQ